ncbi:hypothetical protein [Deinococcus altitudinis]|uniref:hypothetical protein n=1 Tax=Deinococcus altitudinis TaxID=468914 RepID=UPI0038923BC7
MADLLAPAFTSQEMTLHDLLLHVVSRRITATLRILPTGMKLHVSQGALLAVEGGEPLGQLLLSQGTITEDILAAALRLPGPLGQALLARQQVSRDALSAALTQQARVGLTMAMYTPYDTCELLELTPLPSPHAEISASTMLLDALADETLPSAISFHLTASREAVTLSADDWCLLR